MFTKQFIAKPFDWSFYQKYFKGQNLVEEMSYSNYYHSNPQNRLLHVVSFVFFYSLLTAQIFDIFGRLGNLVWTTFFFLIFSRLSAPVAIFYITAMQLGIPIFSGVFPLYFIPILFITFQLFQLLGHVVLEKKYPAFRLFEALVTTPVLVAMTTINEVIPFERQLVNKITEHTQVWKQKIESQKIESQKIESQQIES